eukprot:6655785-Pyramimonas_sp.AAC.1
MGSSGSRVAGRRCVKPKTRRISEKNHSGSGNGSEKSNTTPRSHTIRLECLELTGEWLNGTIVSNVAQSVPFDRSAVANGHQ